MKTKKTVVKLTALTMVAALSFSLAGCANTKSAAEQITDVTEAFKSGDSELFYGSMDESATFDGYFDAVKNKTDSGLGAVYVKLNEKIQDITVTPDAENESYDIPVEVSSYDVYTAAVDKMYEAAKEGPEAFADMPAWLSAALDDAEKKTDTVEFDSRTDSSTMKYTYDSNGEFLEKMTCGLYDFMGATMTTCTDGTDTTCLVAQGDKVLFSADYYYTSLEDYGISKDEAQDYIDTILKEYEGYDGIASDAVFDGKGITQVIFIDYNTVSAHDLVELDFLSSVNADEISLKLTIEGFEQDGMTCTTDTFGIAGADQE